MDEPETNGGSSRVTTFQLYQKLVDIESKQDRRMHELAADVRSLGETLNNRGGVLDRLDDIDGPDGVLTALRSRFVYSLTIIGGAIGAVVYLVFQQGGLPK